MGKKLAKSAVVNPEPSKMAEVDPEVPVVPRRRGRPKGSGDGPKGNVFSIRGSEEWREWVGRLADHSRLKVADVIDRALIVYARQEGFNEPAPRR